MKSSRYPGRSGGGFTLMEMLVVISVIVILSALVIGGFGFVNQKQSRSQAEIQINLLQQALEEYKFDNGSYPVNAVSSGEDGTEEIYDALYYDTDNDGQSYRNDESQPTYLSQLNPEQDQQGWLDGQPADQSGLTIYDPWGTEYYYRTNDPQNPGQTISANPGFDLWSAGPDGRTNPGSGGDYDPEHPDNLDDVRGW